ncbi:sulfur carrier protein ThiS [Alcaligenaceae bacterium]|nr:sulfur carrier protein ThiS [Alcaligenaceae bacterium]
MNITLNGQPLQVDKVSTIGELIAHLGYTDKRIAVEQNGEIVPKSTHGTASLAEGDQLEIVVAVGGG